MPTIIPINLQVQLQALLKSTSALPFPVTLKDFNPLPFTYLEFKRQMVLEAVTGPQLVIYFLAAGRLNHFEFYEYNKDD